MTQPARRILGIDPGRVRIGLAISDPLGVIAQGLPTLQTKNLDSSLAAIAALVLEREIGEIVVGCPRNLDGSRGAMTGFAERIAEDLRQRTGLPVRLWDERLSSAEAERTLIEGEVRREDRARLRDRLAAVLILQGFLDRRSSEGAT